jgi:hypothetical protein
MRRAVQHSECEALTSHSETQGDRSESQGDRREVPKDAQEEDEVRTAREKQVAAHEVQVGQHRDEERPRSQRSSVPDSNLNFEVRTKTRRSRPQCGRRRLACTGDIDSKVRRTTPRCRP